MLAYNETRRAASPHSVPPCNFASRPIYGILPLMPALSFTQIDSPIGPLLLAGDADGLHELWFVEGRRKKQPNPDWKENAKPFAGAIKQLREYFAGKRETFDLPL